MGRYQGGTDSADPLGIMRLTRGIGGARTHPEVGVVPRVIIMVVFPIGWLVIMSGLKWPFFQSWKEWSATPHWKWKVIGSVIIGLTMATMFIYTYEVNHEWQHGGKKGQEQAIRFGELGPSVHRDLWEEEKLWQRKLEMARAKAGR